MGYSIKDLEHLSGIKAHTLRIWEQRYAILKPKRTDTNIRTYTDEDLKSLLNIALLNDNGYKISKIADYSIEALAAEVMKVTEMQFKYPEQVQALTICMVDLNEDRFEKIINNNVLHHGFEKTMVHIIFPFLVKIGYLWQTGSINPGQEHFISYLIRQKLVVAIDGIEKKLTPNPTHFLLYLPEGELHETSLLFTNYLCKSRGHKVTYLGQSMPFVDVEYIYRIQKPDCIFCIVTTSPGPSEIQAYIDKMGRAFTESHIMLTGHQIVGQDLKISSNMTVMHNIANLVDFLTGINFKVEVTA